MMSAELSKQLPPKREIDHIIKLEKGVRPPATVSYCMALSEFEELQKQLKELLDAEFIWPSKALFEAPVLLQKKQDGSTLHRLSSVKQNHIKEQIFDFTHFRLI